MAALLLVLPGALSCSSEGDPVEPAKTQQWTLGANEGQFIDSAVEGLQFVSGDQSGVTNGRGVFSFQSGHEIEFFVGGISLGTATPARKLNPLNLAQTSKVDDPVATNIARFLQTIDDDGDPANGITITEAVRAAAADKTVNFVQEIGDFESDANVQSVIDLLTAETDAGPRELVDASSAQSSLAQGIRSAYGGQYHGPYCVQSESLSEEGGLWVLTVKSDGKATFEFAGAVQFSVTCAMALNGSIFAQDPDRGITVCGSFAPGFQGRWTIGTKTGVYSENVPCSGGVSMVTAEETVCGK